ncbi:MAG TPA: ATP-binding cassette domain-containing protein [Candidatus Eisenbacteria bacterium]|nr:ATP-binding cassette domain-containing protein [Candidatus Eisenbacteria bacterium]
MDQTKPLVEFINYSFYYPSNGERPALCNINLSINKGDLLVFCGMSGSGKTTLLRHLKSEIRPRGKTCGQLIFSDYLTGESAKNKIAFVMENPSSQIVMDSVWHELAFGLENQGIKAEEIERRIAEIANFFGIESWINRRISELSGGEKQILNLASNLVLQPDLLILDEPTAQLDPIARRDFLQMLFYIHNETGLTIVISEHNLSDLLEYADQVVLLNKGKLEFDGTAQGITKFLLKNNHQYQAVLPVAARMSGFWKNKIEFFPISIKEGRDFLENNLLFQNEKEKKDELVIDKKDLVKKPVKNNITRSKKNVLLEADRLWYRYDPEEDLVLKETSIKIYENEIFAILGANGSGKSTLLYLLSKAFQPLKGKIKINKSSKIAMLGQNPEATFSADSVDQVLREYQKQFSYGREEIIEITNRLSISSLLNRHPFDLSAGEKQRVALAKILLIEPDILLLDEPVKSLDMLNKKEIRSIFLELKDKMSIIFVTHDLDFTAEVADRCALLFNKKLLGHAKTEEFFQENNYFTTTSYRLTRNILQDCINFSDIQDKLLQKTLEEEID